MRFSKALFFSVVFVALSGVRARAALVVDNTDADFARLAQTEVDAMRSGARGLVVKSLMDRLDVAAATTTVKMLGPDESTWHPNDHRGTRSHVVATDTRMRGAERKKPTSAVLYLHKTRVDPTLSLFRLGTFVHELSFAADLNEGKFSPDFKTRERRATFYRNGWLDSLHLKPILVSDRVSTPDYPQAKELGLLTEDHAREFPILDPRAVASPTPAP